MESRPALLVTVYSKPGCPLCDEALAEVAIARRQCHFKLQEINILAELELFERYQHAVPVVCVDDEEVFRYRLTAVALLQKLNGGTNKL